MAAETRYPAVLNPLWIVSLFLTFSETTAAIAATQLTGWQQSVLVVFSVVFPIAVACAFFAVLWKRPYVLYAPRDFTSETTVSAYVEAMRTTRQNMAAIELSLDDVVREAIETIGIGEDAATIETAVVAARENLRERFIVIDYGGDFADPDTPPILYSPDRDATVQDLLDYVWYALDREGVPPFTYGDTWKLEIFKGRDLVVQRNSRTHTDDRPLASAGIRSGMRLIARRIS